MPSADPTPGRSPSPPPAVPTASTPGPRASAFITLYNNALSNTLKSISYDSFAACFPLIANQAPDSLRAMHGAFVGRLEGFAKDEFQTILLERNVITNLNALEDLIADARRRKAFSSTSRPIPPHTLPAPQALAAHLAPLQASQQSQLNAKIQTTASQNASLVKKLTEQRGEIQGLVGVLEGVVRDLEKAGGLLQSEGEGLATAAREAEVDMTDYAWRGKIGNGKLGLGS